RDGRYQPGPGLVALGTAAAQRLEPLHTFDVLAADLVDRLGETVVLWIQQGDGLAMAAARDGVQPLRYVAPLGLRLPASGWASRTYLSDDGYPASVPLWYDWAGATFWLVPSPGAEWAGYVRRNPRVSLSISESTPPLRRVLARGPILAVDDADASQWRGVEGRLAARYARLDPARLLEGRAGQSRVLLRSEERRVGKGGRS